VARKNTFHKRLKVDGLPVRDAKGPLHVHITKADVKNSKAKDPAHCAAAVAICREHPGAHAKVYLSRTLVRPLGAKEWTRYKTPQALRTEIVSFDRAKAFDAGDYKLVPLCPSETTEGRANISRTATVTGRTRRAHHVMVGVRPNGAGAYWR
jgi:hypothetical protein